MEFRGFEKVLLLLMMIGFFAFLCKTISVLNTFVGSILGCFVLELSMLKLGI